jgi:tetratricopeptide (TPR) repeat protein
MKRIPVAVLIVAGLALMGGGGAYLWWVGPWAPATGRPVSAADRQRAAKAVEEGKALYAKASNPACRDWDVQALDALRRFRLALDIDRGSLEAHEGAARAALLLGRTGPAVDHADAILRLSPGHALGHEIRGEAQWMMGFEMDGHVLPRPVARFATTRNPPAPEEAARMRKRAEDDFAKAGTVAFPIREAEAKFRAGDLDGAEALAKSANPRLSERDYLLALIHMERGGDPVAMLEPLARRQFTPAVMVRARLELERGEWERLRQDAVIARDAHGEWTDPWHYWGMACLRLGRLAEAREAFMRVVALDPDLGKSGLEETEAAIRKYEAEGKPLPPPPPVKIERP